MLFGFLFTFLFLETQVIIMPLAWTLSKARLKILNRIYIAKLDTEKSLLLLKKPHAKRRWYSRRLYGAE